MGLPGPRGEPELPLPIGGDSRAGAQASVANASAREPYYGTLETGAGFQLLYFGLEIGVAPLEAVDLLGEFLLIDIKEDDY